MKQTPIYKIALLILITVFIFSSCEKDEITSIAFDKASIDIKVGMSDTLTSTIQFTGDMAEFPVEWLTDKNGVFEFTEIEDTQGESSSSKHTLTKKIIVTALKAGSSSITISTGGKTHSCTVTVSQQTFTFTKSLTGYWGDWYDIDLNAFDMYLMENSFHINSQEKIEGTGNLLYLDFNLPLSTTNSLSTGVYFFDETAQPQSFEPGKLIEYDDGDFDVIGSHMMHISQDEMLISLVTDGYYEVTKQGNTYIIEGTLVLHTDEIVRFTYEGNIMVKDNKPEIESLEMDFNNGMCVYKGDSYDSKNTNNFELILYTKTDLGNDSTEIENLLLVEFNTDLAVTDSIPSGTYKMMKALTYEELQAFTIIPGQINDENIWGSWYLSDSIYSYEPYVGGGGAMKIKSGTMEVSKADSIYTIAYDFKNRFGSQVTGIYEGVLEYIDATQARSISASGPAKVKRMHSINDFQLPVQQSQQQKLLPLEWRQIRTHNFNFMKQAGRFPMKKKVLTKQLQNNQE